MKKISIAARLLAGLLLTAASTASVRADDTDMATDAAFHQLGLLSQQQLQVQNEGIPTAPPFYTVKSKGKWGTVDARGQVLIPPAAQEILPADFDLLKVTVKDKVGLYAKTGAEILPPVYDKIFLLPNKMAVITADKKDGIASIDGHILVQPVYKSIVPGADSYAYTEDNKIWGFLDQTGHVMVPAVYKDADLFAEGLAAVKKDNKWGYIDRTGQMVLPAVYEAASDFSEGAALVRTDHTISFIDHSGQTLASFPGDEFVSPLKNGFAIIKNDGKFVYIRTDGTSLPPISAWKAFPFQDGRALIQRKANHFGFGNLLSIVSTVFMATSYHSYDGQNMPLSVTTKDYKIGYIDTTGKEYIPTTYDFVGPYESGRVLVEIKGQYGYLDEAGQPVIPAEWDDISYFTGAQKDITLVKKDDIYRFYRLGTGPFSKRYIAAHPFSDGLAAVEPVEGKWAYIDETGRTALPLKYDEAGDFHYGAAKVVIDGKTAVIRKDGTFLAQPGEFEDFKAVQEGSYLYKQKGKWGILDPSGTPITAPLYEEIY